MSGPVRVAYDALIAASELKPDPAQARAVEALDRLAGTLNGKEGLFARLFGPTNDGPAGVYLWGGVGRGKSMLMDLAFEQIDIRPKRRGRFHAIMYSAQERGGPARRKGGGGPDRAAAPASARGGERLSAC